MFGRSRYELMEDAFMKHMDKEEQSFRKLIETLDLIKDEIHKTNMHMTEIESSQTLRLLENKTQILEIVFKRLVEKHEYEPKIKEIESDLKDLCNKLDNKVGRGEVKVGWGLFITISGFIVWVSKYIN